VWHVSVRSDSLRKSKSICRKFLNGVGDSRYEWSESGGAYHIRRRMTKSEQLIAGSPKDIRNTTEQIERINALPEDIRTLAESHGLLYE